MTTVIELHHQRAQVIQGIREFFAGRDFAEVICPVLNTGVPAEPTIYPFTTRWDRGATTQELYLPVSPERAMKQYLAAGGGNCYTIGHCFRNLEGTGPTHHPEFLMLEWYRLDENYQKIITDTQELICYLNTKINHSDRLEWRGQAYDLSHWEVFSLEEWWQAKFDCSIADIESEAALAALAASRGYQVAGSDWEQLFNQLLLNEIEPEFPAAAFILLDFPAKISPLCRPRPDRPWLAERFEAYLGHLELGNGNSEQLNAASVQTQLAAEIARRQQAGQPAPPLDEELLAALRRLYASGHRYAGMGLGVDRLVLVLTDGADINDWWPKLA